MKIAALIPCRIGSKEIPNKNFREFAGKQLWEWSFIAARESGIFNKIIISSDGGLNGTPFDDKVIADNKRPTQLSDDTASLDSLLVYYSQLYPNFTLWCLLQPTSPLRSAIDIKEAYSKVKNKGYDSLVSVVKDPGMIWVDNAAGLKGKNYPIATYHIHKRPNRQDRKDWYKENGAIYFTKKHVLDQMGVRLGGEIALYEMPHERSLEIDNSFDWEVAEYVKKRREYDVA